jgi:hypothetical protein
VWVTALSPRSVKTPLVDDYVVGAGVLPRR